jgi:hypothetical protein
MSRIAASLFAAILLGATGAAAEGPAREAAAGPALCASYETHAAYLAGRYGEFPVFTGQMDDGLVFRVFANGRSGSWTMLLIRADGLACVQAAGEGGQREAGI